jgi:hypothetical protein
MHMQKSTSNRPCQRPSINKHGYKNTINAQEALCARLDVHGHNPCTALPGHFPQLPCWVYYCITHAAEASSSVSA